MIRVGRETSGIERLCRNTLLGGLLTAIAVSQIGASAKPLIASVGGGDGRIVIVHSGDRIGMDGLVAARSCMRQNAAISEQNAIDGVQSVLLIMKYDNGGKIVGVHYGAKDVCEFLRTAPSKLS